MKIITTIILLFSLNHLWFSKEVFSKEVFSKEVLSKEVLAKEAIEKETITKQAIDFELPTKNASIKLSELKGNVVYIDFWASWCAPCRKSFPWMNKMQAKYETQGLKIIGISLDSTHEGADKFLKKIPALFTIAYDTKGNTADAYKVQVMPTSYLIDRQGNLIYTHKGFNKKYEAKLEDELRKALAKP